MRNDGVVTPVMRKETHDQARAKHLSKVKGFWKYIEKLQAQLNVLMRDTVDSYEIVAYKFKKCTKEFQEMSKSKSYMGLSKEEMETIVEHYEVLLKNMTSKESSTIEEGIGNHSQNSWVNVVKKNVTLNSKVMPLNFVSPHIRRGYLWLNRMKRKLRK